MKKRLVMLFAGLALSITGVGLLQAPEASAVCGGGGPGEPCYCPGSVGKIHLFYC